LLVTAVWVLAVVARPYEWWRVVLVAVSGLAYVVIFSLPPAQRLFMLDTSNVTITSMALGIGVIGAAIIEVLWWVQGALMGERRRLWRSR
jgi:cation-transporting ATPase E